LSSPRPVRFGVLGCARIVRRGVARGIQQAADAHLLGIASRDAETAQAWAAEFGVERAYGSYEAMLADPQIDALYIPLPNELHAEWTLRAAAAGKHVLCEKPLALDAAEAERMTRGCAERGVVLMEAFMWRHHPRVEQARRLIAAGALGTLRLVKMDFSFDIARDDWRIDPARPRGGGALFDLGCYAINAARLFTGEEPREVVARARYASPDVDMTLGMLVTFPSGVQLLADCSFECPDRNRIEVVGTQGVLEFPQGVLPPPESTLVWRTDEREETLQFPLADQYALEVEAFCRGVQTGKLPDPAEDGLANMRAVEAVRHAALAAAPR
jgi:D-xylose 1-dehydrogenase (NADP+, D-xylono-1,5-lactone-forming)